MTQAIAEALTIFGLFVMLIYVLGTCVSYFFDDFYQPTPAEIAKRQTKSLIRKANVFLFRRRFLRAVKFWKRVG